RAAQSSVTIDPSEHPDETREVMARIITDNITDYARRFLRHMEFEEIPADAEAAKGHGMLMNLSASLPREVAEDFQKRMQALVKEFDDYPRDPDGIRVEGMVSWFSPSKPGGRGGRAGRSDADDRDAPGDRPGPES